VSARRGLHPFRGKSASRPSGHWQCPQRTERVDITTVKPSGNITADTFAPADGHLDGLRRSGEPAAA
jgi:hypothetical protein